MDKQEETAKNASLNHEELQQKIQQLQDDKRLAETESARITQELNTRAAQLEEELRIALKQASEEREVKALCTTTLKQIEEDLKNEKARFEALTT